MIKEFLRRCSEYVVDPVDLIQFVISGKQGKQWQHLKEYTSHAPYIHFITVVAISEETLRSSVPSGGDVFGKGWLAIDAPTTTKVC